MLLTENSKGHSGGGKEVKNLEKIEKAGKTCHFAGSHGGWPPSLNGQYHLLSDGILRCLDNNNNVIGYYLSLI